MKAYNNMEGGVVYLGADHAGFALKESVKEELVMRGVEVVDLGAHKLDPRDDYPVYAKRVAVAVVEARETHGVEALGILACGSAQGVCIVANKIDGVRAVIGYSVEGARLGRRDDDANILCLPGQVALEEDPLDIVRAFLDTVYSAEERHARRLAQIHDLEQQN